MSQLVSVIIPCYNAESYINRSIQSVFEQDWDSIELIVVDDGSTDNSKTEILKWRNLSDDHLILKYVYQNNKGLAGAIERGLQEVTGEYLTLLDADDYYLPQSISKKVNYLINHTECPLVRSNGYIESGSNRWLFVYDEKEKNNPDVFSLLMEGKTMNWAGSYMIRTEKLFRFYPKREIYSSRFGQNLQLMLPVAKDAKCGFIDEPLMVYVRNNDSLSQESNLTKKKEKSLSNIEGYYDIRIHMIVQLYKTDGEKAYWNNVANGIRYKSKLNLGIELKDSGMIEQSYKRLIEIHQIDIDTQIVYWNHKNKIIAFILKAKRKIMNARHQKMINNYHIARKFLNISRLKYRVISHSYTEPNRNNNKMVFS